MCSSFDKDKTEFCISLDTDDTTMNNEEVFEKLEKYDNVSYFVSNNKSNSASLSIDIKSETYRFQCK